MIRQPPDFTRPDTLFPYTTLCRSSQFGRIGLHHERLGIAADRVDPCHTAHGLQLRADDPVLDGPQISGFGNLIGEQLALRRKIAAVGLPARLSSHFLCALAVGIGVRSEEHTSELQSLMRNSYAVFCLTKKTKIG